jgi:hypothetical protein
VGVTDGVAWISNAIEVSPAAGAASDVVTTGGAISSDDVITGSIVELLTDSIGSAADVLGSDTTQVCELDDGIAAAYDVLETPTLGKELFVGTATTSDVLGTSMLVKGLVAESSGGAGSPCDGNTSTVVKVEG